MSPAFSICVYCGSRAGNHSGFAETAREVGRWIGERNGQLVYGGGNHGSMGTVANAALEAGAYVVGVIPKALVELEHAHRDLSELLVVENMHERKRIMAERCDAFLTLPGGIGTLEEFFEVWSWRQLGYHAKPIGLLNQHGYYDALLAFLASCVRNEFMGGWQMELIQIGAHAAPLLASLVQNAGSNVSDAILSDKI